MVICLERGADLHMAQLIPLLLTVSCFSKIQIGFTYLVPAHLGSPGKGPLNGCVCVCHLIFLKIYFIICCLSVCPNYPCLLQTILSAIFCTDLENLTITLLVGHLEEHPPCKN